MKRPLRLLAVFLLVAGVITCICVFDRPVLHFLGWDTQQSDNYDAFSGSLPVIVSILGLSTIITGLWHHINCRAPGCVRVGHYPDSRGVKWCWRHHPDHGGKRPTLELLHRLHREHVKRQAGAP